MKKYNYFLLIFLLINSLIGLIEAQQFPKSKNLSEFMRKSKTTDIVYINDTVIYLMNKSPLEVFSGYKDLYASFNLPQPPNLPWMPYGARVNLHAAYHVTWFIRDCMLYLGDIEIQNAGICDYKSFFPNNEQYPLMEELTNVKFDKKYPLPSNSRPWPYHNPTGMMPATWFNDTILIKISTTQYLGGQGRLRPVYCSDFNDTIWFKLPASPIKLDKWKKIPSEELVFKNGRLISRKTTDIY